MRRRQRRNILRYNRNNAALRIEGLLAEVARRFRSVGRELQNTQWSSGSEHMINEWPELFPPPIMTRHHMFRHIGQQMFRVARDLSSLRDDVLEPRAFSRSADRGILGPLTEVYNEMRVFRFSFRKYSQFIRVQLRRTLVPQFNALDIALNGLLRQCENEAHTRLRVNTGDFDNILRDMEEEHFELVEDMLLDPESEAHIEGEVF